MKKKISIIIISLFYITTNSQNCSDLFISEYVEGPGNNNAIEIYNPTSSSIDLFGYTINRYSNGASSGPESWQLGGMIASNEALVIGNGQVDSIWVSTYWSLPVDPLFYSLLDDHCNGDYDANSTFYFNGDDAITLEKNGNIIDIFGKVGEDPGAAWTDDVTAGYTDANGGTWWTKRQTLIRKPSVMQGVNQNPILFNASLQWDSLPDATYSELGYHNCDCISSSVKNINNISYRIYPNPIQKLDHLIIQSEDQITNINIYNLLGEKICQSNNTNRIFIKNIAKGTYIIDINFYNNISVKEKIIIE